MTDQPEAPREDVEERTNDDIAGVQGGDVLPEDDAVQAPGLGETPDAPAPDAAEIEWAGGEITKPPHPAG